MKIKTVAGLLAFCVGVSASAETRTFALEPGEYWWGATVASGHLIPLSAASVHTRDLRISIDGNQAAPLLLSTKGRWVWCEDAFRYEFTNGVLTVETGPAPRQTGATPHPMDVAAAEEAVREPSRTVPPVAAAIPNVALTCYSKKTFAPIQSGRAPEGNLRGAFLHCSRTFFPPKGMPRRAFSRLRRRRDGRDCRCCGRSISSIRAAATRR